MNKIRQARHKLDLSLHGMATMLGYTGAHRRNMMHDLETGRRSLRPAQERLLDAYLSGYRPKDWPRKDLSG